MEGFTEAKANFLSLSPRWAHLFPVTGCNCTALHKLLLLCLHSCYAHCGCTCACMEITEKLRAFLIDFYQMMVLKIISVYLYFDSRQLKEQSELIGENSPCQLSAGGQGTSRGCEMTVSWTCQVILASSLGVWPNPSVWWTAQGQRQPLPRGSWRMAEDE